MVANYAAMDIRPGSMGRPLPGIEAAIVRKTGDGQRRGHRGAGRPGRAGAPPGMAVDVPRLLGRARALPEVLRRRLLPDRRPRPARSGRLLLVRRARGRRDQDLGPSDRSVRGGERPDGAPGRGRGRRHRQARPGGAARWSRRSSRSRTATSRATSSAASCWAFARKRLGAVVAPKEIEFRPTLPKTRAGKIMRRLLRAQELGLPEGDTSTLETS